MIAHRGGALHVENVPAAEIADTVGTPTYVYSLGALREQYRSFDRAFAAIPHTVCFAIKANQNLAVASALRAEGSGFDVTSAGELFRALRAGGDPKKIVFSGVGKRDDEIAYALREGILQFNAESSAEIDAIDRVARDLGTRAPLALRVNPNVDPKTHPYISTGMKKAKFGIDIRIARDEYERARSLPGIEVVGVDCHIGSQLTQVAPFRDALAIVRELIDDLKQRDFDIRYLDFGGGLGIRYDDETPPTPEAYAKVVTDALAGLDIHLLLEPGRFLVGNAGIFLTRVLFRKETETKTFVIVDGAMNDLIRPALYQAYQRIEPVLQQERPSEVVDVVGPVCESGDFLATDRELPRAEIGELLSVASSGAYGFVMSSNYNARPRAAEVLVDGSDVHVVRERESMEDLIRGESIPEFLRAE